MWENVDMITGTAWAAAIAAILYLASLAINFIAGVCNLVFVLIHKHKSPVIKDEHETMYDEER